MTLVAVWHTEHRINAIADTRVVRSVGNVLTEHGPKILPLRIVCKQPNYRGDFERVVYDQEIGFAYSGATLPAMATHSLANIYFSNLSSAHGAATPSMAVIANAVGRIARAYMLEVGALNGEAALFQCAVFGRCTETNSLRSFQLVPRIDGQQLILTTSELSTSSPDEVLILGSCVDLFRERIKTKRAAAESQLLKDRAPIAALKEIIDNNEHESVGGRLQRSRVTQQGFRIVAGLEPIPAIESGRNSGLFVMGFDTMEVEQVGDYIIATIGQI